MQAKDIFALGKRAYNGDTQARKDWFETLAPIAKRAAKPYGVLPGVILARAALESGWGSDLYEKVMERKFGVWFASKAQNHNNMVGMVAYGKNDEYSATLPAPAWAGYKEVFEDYGPHGDMSGDYKLAREKWKDYRSIEDCFEDFAAVLRAQAARRKESWPSDLRGQLLSIGRGYTPEGAPSDMGMDFAWQDKTLSLYAEFSLWRFDGKSGMEKAPMKDLERYIRAAYAFAHKYCTYGRTDTHFPPGQTGVLDCVGLIFLALWMMGRFERMMNINQVVDLCLANGMKRSDNPADVWKRKGVVCFQSDHLNGTQHISHVYYSLGGSGLGDISKYDLGSDKRIKSVQPFGHVAVNEWPGEMHFLCMLYLPDEEKREPIQKFEVSGEVLGKAVKSAGVYSGPGTTWNRLGSLKEGADVVLRGYVTNDKGNVWMTIRVGMTEGFVYSSAVKKVGAYEPWDGIVSGTDGSLSLRIAPGAFKVADIPEGAVLSVDGESGDWLHVRAGKKLWGFVYKDYVKKQ